MKRFVRALILLALLAAPCARAELMCNDAAAGESLSITESGSYEVSGEGERVEISVGKGEHVVLTLRDATLECPDGAAISVLSGDVTLVLAGENQLGGGSEEEPAALYAKDDLEIMGSGALTAEGSYRHGIECRDDLTVGGGTIAIRAEKDGLRGRDSVTIRDGVIAIEAGNDGIKSGNEEKGDVRILGGSLSIQAGDDAIHGERSLIIEGGSLLVEDCFEGLEAHQIEIDGGTLDVTARDDAINASGEEDAMVTIAGGSLRLTAGGDGIDSNGHMAIGGCSLAVSGPISPRNAPLDFIGSCPATDCTVAASGSAGMIQSPDGDENHSCLRVFFDQIQPAGQVVSLLDGEGKLILAFAPDNDFQAVVFAHPALQRGEEVQILLGGTVAGLDRGTLTEEGTQEGGTLLCSVTLSEALTSIDENGNACSYAPNAYGW